MTPITLTGELHFKLRFNTTHGDTNLYWRVIIDDVEYLAVILKCDVPTWSDQSFDTRANAIKWHMAGDCKHFQIDEEGTATFK